MRSEDIYKAGVAVAKFASRAWTIEVYRQTCREGIEAFILSPSWDHQATPRWLLEGAYHLLNVTPLGE